MSYVNEFINMRILSVIGGGINRLRKLSDYLVRKHAVRLFRSFGEGSYIGHDCVFSHETVSIGEHTYIGSKCVFVSVHGSICIGNHVMFGVGVHIHGGDHIYDRMGVYMDEVGKEMGHDKEVVIEDDVWVGANAIILGGKQGIHLGEGCIIGAGSVVNKDIPPYAIAVGNPAKVVKMRFTEEQIKEHKRLLAQRNNGNGYTIDK